MNAPIKMVNILKRFIDALIYIFLNYFIAYIPSWMIRKFFYKLFGMKIGRKTRIYMKCIVRAPWKIEIDENTVINENCYLDGRGGLKIGKNTSISFFTIIISASHNSTSQKFDYIKSPVIIKDNVWTGARSIILQGTTLEDECILAAGSTLKGATEKGYIYAGIPAKKMKSRNLQGKYIFSPYDFFR